MKVPFSGHSHRIAFTLVEVLVAIAVLSIILFFLGTVATSVGSVSTGALQNAEDSGNARAILDLMSRELEAGVSRPDLNQTNWISVTDSGSTLQFYSQNTGSATASGTLNSYRPLSYIAYSWSQGATNSYLARGDQAVLWSDAPLTRIPLGGPSSTPVKPALSDVLDGVIAFQVTFLQQDGTFSAGYSGTNTIAATLSLALADSHSLKLLIKLAKLQDLSTMLTHASAGSAGTEISGGSTTSPKMDWENIIKSSTGMDAYPQQVRKGLRFFERTVDLPKPIL